MFALAVRTNSGIVGVPVTYTVDGVQYVAVAILDLAAQMPL